MLVATCRPLGGRQQAGDELGLGQARPRDGGQPGGLGGAHADDVGTIPADKAGVGSALNDTIQQAGTALGIAILGSLLASGYARLMPAAAPAAARHSIAGALEIAGRDAGLIHAARDAFASAMSAAFTVSAIGVLAAAVLATVVMRDARPEPVAAPANDGELVS